MQCGTKGCDPQEGVIISGQSNQSSEALAYGTDFDRILWPLVAEETAEEKAWLINTHILSEEDWLGLGAKEYL